MKSFTYAYYFFFYFYFSNKVGGVCMYQVTVMLKD